MNHSADEGRAAPKGLLRRTLDKIRLRSPGKDDSGLTLLEMLAVILVVAILATGGFIAIQRIRGGAQSSVAKTNLSTAVTAVVTAHGVQQDGQFDTAGFAGHLNGFLEDLTAVAYNGTDVIAGYKGWQWTGATAPAPNQVAVAINDTAIPDASNAWGVGIGDAVWLITRAEDGDTYCALVVLEIAGDTEKGGTRYDAALSESDVATCGLDAATTTHIASAAVRTAAGAAAGLINTDPATPPANVSDVVSGSVKAEFTASIPDAN